MSHTFLPDSSCTSARWVPGETRRPHPVSLCKHTTKRILPEQPRPPASGALTASKPLETQSDREPRPRPPWTLGKRRTIRTGAVTILCRGTAPPGRREPERQWRVPLCPADSLGLALGGLSREPRRHGESAGEAGPQEPPGLGPERAATRGRGHFGEHWTERQPLGCLARTHRSAPHGGKCKNMDFMF